MPTRGLKTKTQTGLTFCFPFMSKAFNAEDTSLYEENNRTGRHKVTGQKEAEVLLCLRLYSFFHEFWHLKINYISQSKNVLLSINVTDYSLSFSADPDGQ